MIYCVLLSIDIILVVIVMVCLELQRYYVLYKVPGYGVVELPTINHNHGFVAVYSPE